MKRARFVSTVLSLVLAVACASTQGSQDAEQFVSGTWIGDFGPAFYDRNTIALELNWDGMKLTGMVRPGVPGARMYRNFASFPIENASFDPKTGIVRFEATYEPRGRRYFIQGKVSKNT